MGVDLCWREIGNCGTNYQGRRQAEDSRNTEVDGQGSRKIKEKYLARLKGRVGRELSGEKHGDVRIQQHEGQRVGLHSP